MRKKSKIFATLLAVALMISCCALAVSADDASAVAYDYDNVLEYYESESYLNASFDGASDLASAIANSSDSFSANGKVSYTANANGTATMKSLAPLYFDVVTDASVSFGFNTRLSLDSGSSAISLRLNSSVRGGSSNNVLKLFEITRTAVSVYDGEVNSVPQYKNVEVSGANLAVGSTMFDVCFFLDTSKGEANLVVTVDGMDPISVSIGTDNFSFKAFDISTNYITMDKCEIYQGSFVRSLSDNEADIAALLNEIVAEYNKDTSNFVYLEAVAKVVVTYGFDSELSTDSARFAIGVVAPKYADFYITSVAGLKGELPYNESIAVIGAIAPYGEFIESLYNSAYANVDGVDYDAVFGNKTNIDAELERLAKAKEDTLISYEVILSVSNVYSATYAELKAVYDVVKEHPICESYYDEVYSADAIILAYRYSNAIVTEFEKKDSMAKIFVAQVPVMCNEELSFAERYEAFTLATSNKFTDTTYNAYLDGVTIDSLISAYDSAAVSIKVVADYAEEFLLKIKEAYLTSSYAVKIVALDAAELYLEDVEVGYPGVSDSIELYYTIREDIAARIEATRNYINAVLAVEAAETVEEKKAAIEIANAYAVLGSDVTVEVSDMPITVTQANIILSNESSKILLGETAVNTYVSLVESISTITDAAQRRAAINKAVALRETVDSENADVSAASALLASAIEAYNADVNEANAASAESNGLALSTFSATAPSLITSQIVAIIKKFYE